MNTSNIKSLTMNELMVLAKNIPYTHPNYSQDKWTTEDIYYAALCETVNSQYQIRASEIICGVFPPLKLLFKKTLRSYINIMLLRNQNNVNEVELSS